MLNSLFNLPLKLFSLWGEYAPADTPVWLYSLTYNGGYMLPELIITAFGVFVLQKYLLNIDRQ